jgi:hypothetical protein
MTIKVMMVAVLLHLKYQAPNPHQRKSGVRRSYRMLMFLQAVSKVY